MADRNKKQAENIEGEFFIDTSCINYDTCRRMAPDTFDRVKNHSYVYHQPEELPEELPALCALLSCPVSAIGTETPNKNIKNAQETLPIQIAEDIYHCGYHSKKSFGAASYLIIHPQGNILIDSPRFNESLHP